MQLDLAFWPSTCVRSVLADYMAMKAESLTGETLELDYKYRVEWLVEVLGEGTPAKDVGFNALEAAARGARGVLRDVTIRRRLTFWRAAVKYAAQRGVVPKDAIPEMPPWLRDDSVRCEDFYTLAQFTEFRMALAPGRMRRCADLSFWTGQHSIDIASFQRWMLEPDYQWDGTDVCGRWWRRNHKNKRCTPCWIPMEKELRELAIEWKAKRDPDEARIVGATGSLRKAFHIAAHRAGVPAIRANLGLRASHATLLMARGYPYEYVRQVLGHEGEMYQGKEGSKLRVTRPSTLSRHYLRSSSDLLRPRS